MRPRLLVQDPKLGLGTVCQTGCRLLWCLVRSAIRQLRNHLHYYVFSKCTCKPLEDSQTGRATCHAGCGRQPAGRPYLFGH